MYFTRGGAVGGSAPRLYQETDQIWNESVPSVSLAKFPLLSLLSSFPHHGDCVHGHPGEQVSEAPSVDILHRETGDKVFGERLGVTARLCSSSSLPIYIIFIRRGAIDLSLWATTMVELLLWFRPSRSPRTCF
jgi:hypothetical protein